MEPRMEFLPNDKIKRDKHHQWPTDLKVRIVSESLRSGVTVQQIADRYGVRANYLSSWRTLARQGKLVLPSSQDETEFAAIVVASPAVEPPVKPASRVEIFSGSVIIRLEEGASASRIAAVASALAGLE